MPFPVIGVIGAVVASVLLGVVLTIFGLTLRALDRAVTRVADSILDGLVVGLQGWSAARDAIRRISPGAVDREDVAGGVSVEHVRGTVARP
jgi:hypothetical protein